MVGCPSLERERDVRAGISMGVLSIFKAMGFNEISKVVHLER